MSGRYIDLSWEEALSGHGAAWRGLVETADLNPSLLPDWMACGLASLDRPAALRAFVGLDSRGALEGVLPYYRHEIRMNGLRVRAVELGGNPVSYHQEIPSVRDPGELLEHFLAQPDDWDMLCMINLGVGGPTWLAARKAAGTHGLPLIALPGESSPFMTLEGGWEDYLGTKSKKHRYRLRKQEKLLFGSPGLRMEWFESHCEGLLDAMLRIESGSWKASAGMDIPGRPHELRYHRRLLPMLVERRLLLANVLYSGGEPAAYGLCYRWNGRIGQLKTSFQEKFAEWSPGALVLMATLRRAFDEGCREFDFLGDEMPHKTIWDTRTRAHETLMIFGPSKKGRLLGGLKGMLARARRIAGEGK